MGMGSRASSGGDSKTDREYADETAAGVQRREGSRLGGGGPRAAVNRKRLVHADSNTIPVRQFRTDGQLFVCESGGETGDHEGGEKEGIKSRKKSQKIMFSAAQGGHEANPTGRIETTRVPVNQIPIGVRWDL
ncbi:hypothetical protein B0H16DRAFT_1467297 [Mycena metata]|uniref:Uncharacterized protein n=1 Tax=Mycena metata TaxID=1033252 RepID=A0AAD7MVX6_9AGAR|nr:hypothetical protein B0H16DRAFT_1467297 [Mycena metata]